MARPSQNPEEQAHRRVHGKGSAGVTGAEFVGVGIQFAGAILLFLFVGQWLDERLGTAPWLLLVGVFVGAAAGFYSIYRQLTATSRDRQGPDGQR